MVHDLDTKASAFVLPVAIVAPADVVRIGRELEDVDEFLRQSELRKGGKNTALPKTTKSLHEFAEANGLNLLQAVDRAKLSSFVDELRGKAPVVHISFAADPSAAFVDKIVAWLRQNVHPQLLVQLGLQPTIGAGCVIRTTNKYFDFSLRQYLVQRRELLIQAIAGMQQ